MSRAMRGMLALALFGLFGMAAAYAQNDELVENPKYKLWSNFKPGAFSTYTEKTKFGPTKDKDGPPPGVDEKTVTYRLVSTNKDKVVVATTVIEEDLLGFVETAPTRLHYPAKIKKGNLEAVLAEFGAKPGDDETITVGKNEVKCKVLAGSYKKGDATVEYKLYYSDTVPGGIVKRTRVTKDGDKLVADTSIMLRSFGEAKATPKPKVDTDQ